MLNEVELLIYKVELLVRFFLKIFRARHQLKPEGWRHQHNHARSAETARG